MSSCFWLLPLIWSLDHTGARHYLPNQQTTCGPSECAPKTANSLTNPLPFFVAIFETGNSLVLLQKSLDLPCLICSSTSFFLTENQPIYWFNPIRIYALFLQISKSRKLRVFCCMYFLPLRYAVLAFFDKCLKNLLH